MEQKEKLSFFSVFRGHSFNWLSRSAKLELVERFSPLHQSISNYQKFKGHPVCKARCVGLDGFILYCLEI